MRAPPALLLWLAAVLAVFGVTRAADEPSSLLSKAKKIDQVAAVDEVYKTIENKVDAILEAARAKKADVLGKASSDPKCVPRLKRPWHGPSVVMADSTWMAPFYAGVAQALLERGVITAGWTPFGGAGGGAVTAVLTNAGYDGYAQLGLASQITAAMCPGTPPVCNTTAFTGLAMGVWGAALPSNVGYLLGDRTHVWLSTWTGSSPQYGSSIPYNLTSFTSRYDVLMALLGTTFMPCLTDPGTYGTMPVNASVGAGPSVRPVIGGRYSADFAELAYGLPGPYLTVAADVLGKRSFSDAGASLDGGWTTCPYVQDPYTAPATDLTVTPPLPTTDAPWPGFPPSCANITAGFNPPAVTQGSTLAALPDWEAEDRAALAEATGGKLGSEDGLGAKAREVAGKLAAAKAGARAGVKEAATEAGAWLLEKKGELTPAGLGGMKGVPSNRSGAPPVDVDAVKAAVAAAKEAVAAEKAGAAEINPTDGLRYPSIYPGARTPVPFTACDWLSFTVVPPSLADLPAIFKVGLREGQAWADEHGYCCDGGNGDGKRKRR